MGKNRKKRYLSKKNNKKEKSPNESSSDLEMLSTALAHPLNVQSMLQHQLSITK